ncbi:MAG: hypothetical protein AB7P17_04325 [Nitrospirales bacterium]
MNNSKKLKYLVVLLALWGVVTIMQWIEFSGTGDQAPGPLTQTDAGLTATLSTKDLHLAKEFPNTRQRVKLSNPRNIFAPLGSSVQTARESRTTTQQTARSLPTVPVPPPLPPGPSPAELAAQRARQELNRFRFLGFLTKGGESQAFLTNGQAIYIVKQGEMLDGRVQVYKIEPETIILSTKVVETGNLIQASIPLTPDTNG